MLDSYKPSTVLTILDDGYSLGVPMLLLEIPSNSLQNHTFNMVNMAVPLKAEPSPIPYYIHLYKTRQNIQDQLVKSTHQP